MKMSRFLLATLVFAGFSAPAMAHSGGTDSNGGHMDRRTGSYHFHGGGGGGGWGGGISRGSDFSSLQAVQNQMIESANARVEAQTARRARNAYRTAARKEAKHQASEPSATNPQEPTESQANREKSAATRLRVAKLYIEQKNWAVALNYLQDLVNSFPETKAAEEGRPLLNGLKSQPQPKPIPTRNGFPIRKGL